MNRPLHVTATLVAAALSMLLPGTALAQDNKPDNWTGQLVVGKKPPKEITFGDVVDGKQIYFEFNGRYPQKVRADRDGWLRLFDGHKEGWAKKDDFILSRDATAYFTTRINANASDSFAWHMRAIAWSDRGEYDSAIKDYTECIRLDPKDASAFNGRGSAWAAKKEYDQAIKDYDEALRLDPSFPLAFVGRGIAWRNKKEYDRAIRDYDEAIRLDPKYPLAFNNRGNAYLYKKDYDKAIKDYDEAIRLDPSFPLAFISRGIAWRNKKEYDRAIRDYDEAIRLDPKDPLAFNNRGCCRYLLKDYDKALADFDACLKLDAKKVHATGNRGLVFAAQHRYPQAVEAFEAALALKDDSYAPYEYAEFLASCPEGKYRDGTKALVLAKKSLEMKGKDAGWEVHAALAAAYAETGDFELAVTSQRAVLEDKDCTGDDRKQQEARLELYRAKKPYRAN